MLALSQKPKLPSLPQETIDDWKPRIFSLEFFVVFLVVVITTGCLDGFFFHSYAQDSNLIQTEGSRERLVRFLVILPAYMYGLFYMVSRPSKALHCLKTNFAFSIIFFLVFLSAVWSLDSMITLQRSVHLLFTSSFGLYLASRYSLARLTELLEACFLLVCLFSLATVLVDPGNAIHHDEHFPAIRAYFSHKNSFGMVMGIIATLTYILARSSISRKLGVWFCLLALSLAAGSLSRTTWVNIAIMILTFHSFIFFRTHRRLGTFFLLLVLSLAGIIVANIGPDKIISLIGSLLDRDLTTLTGRTQIWEGVLNAVSGDRFWLGYGYAAFWTSPNGAMAWFPNGVPVHAHNGWLQTMVSIGIVGTILITIVLLKSLFKMLRLATATSDIRYTFGFIFFVYFMLGNFSEPTFLVSDKIVWILFVYFAYYTKSEQEPIKAPHPAFLLNKGTNNAR